MVRTSDVAGAAAGALGQASASCNAGEALIMSNGSAGPIQFRADAVCASTS